MTMKVFPDTNVLLDVLVYNRPGAVYSMAVLTMVKNHMLEAEVTTQSIIDAEYISHHYKTPRERFAAFIGEISRYVNIDYIDATNIGWALDHSSGDFEDDAQYSSAHSWTCDYYLTWDKDMLKRTEYGNVLTVITPEDFMSIVTAEEE